MTRHHRWRQARRFAAPLAIAYAFAGSLPAYGQTPDDPGPFADVDLAALAPAQRDSIRAAHEDFARVVAGAEPIHAIADAATPLPADGGTRFFRGNGYRLTILKSLSSFGSGDARVVGFVYGPVLTFDPEIAQGNTATLVQTRFYTPAQLRALTAKR